MDLGMGPHAPLLEPLAAHERLCPEDMAARRDAEFLADALAAQQLRARGGLLVRVGVCCNCSARCAPRAVYCDADCQADHEARLRSLARQGRGRQCGGATT